MPEQTEQERIEELEREAGRSRNYISHLQKELDESAQHHAEQRQRIDELKQRLEQRNAQLIEAQDEVERLSGELEGRSVVYPAYEKAIVDWRDHCDKLNRELEDVRTQLDREKLRGDSFRDITRGVTAMLSADLKRLVEEHLGQPQQRQVSTVEELEALGIGSVIRRNGVAYMRIFGAGQWTGVNALPWSSEQIFDSYGRFTIEVLHEAV